MQTNRIKKRAVTNQLSFLLPGLAEQLDPRHGLYQLALQINWEFFDKEFSALYSDNFGRPAKPIRLMVSLLILKHLRNLSDESVVEQWSENCYYQFFSGQKEFSPKFPCSATELVMFRNRIGSEGIEKILLESIRINGKDSEEQEIIGDTTVQEKNITYPVDTKLHQKIIRKYWQIIDEKGFEVRQSYRRIVAKLRYQTRGRNHPKHAVKSRRAERKIKTIAGRLVRELKRVLSPNDYHQNLLEIFQKVINQKRTDKNKIYSLHELDVNCISKGKDHKKYEFGNKVSILRTKTTGVIVGALSFDKNIYDGNTLDEALNQYQKLIGKEPRKIILDLGYRGRSKINSTEIVTPDKFKRTKISQYLRRKHQKDMRRRSSIEPVIGHLKQDHRVGRNYLKGLKGDQINILLAAAAYNFKRFIRLKGWFIDFSNFQYTLELILWSFMYLNRIQFAQENQD